MKRLTKEEVKKLHPFCCYCGGENEFETVDHNPAKIFFINKNPPEGYDQFPACKKCNQRVSREENLFGLITKFSNKTSQIPEEYKKFQSMLHSTRDREAGFVREVFFSTTTRDKRRYVRSQKIKLLPGQFYHELKVPILIISGPIFKEVANIIGRKLFLGLHYKHTNNIVPLEGRVVFRWDNIRTVFNNISAEFIEGLDQRPIIKRAGKDLKPEFDYFFGFGENSTRYLVSFRNMIFFTGLVYEKPTEDLVNKAQEKGVFKIFPPFPP